MSSRLELNEAFVLFSAVEFLALSYCSYRGFFKDYKF